MCSGPQWTNHKPSRWRTNYRCAMQRERALSPINYIEKMAHNANYTNHMIIVFNVNKSTMACMYSWINEGRASCVYWSCLVFFVWSSVLARDFVEFLLGKKGGNVKMLSLFQFGWLNAWERWSIDLKIMSSDLIKLKKNYDETRSKFSIPFCLNPKFQMFVCDLFWTQIEWIR